MFPASRGSFSWCSSVSPVNEHRKRASASREATKLQKYLDNGKVVKNVMFYFVFRQSSSLHKTETASELKTAETRVCCLDSVLRREEQWWHKKPKTAKITEKHNGHTRGEFVLIILRKKRGYFRVLSVLNQRYFVPRTTCYKALKFSTVSHVT